MAKVGQISFLETSKEYEEFVDKFKQKKTTDDCYTPSIVFDAVQTWVCKTYGVDPEQIVRPFWPGGDYEREDYPPDAVVLDNPPFSIVSQIVNFYNEHGIKYFLFAPHLSNLGIARGFGCCHVIIGAGITYENGAVVSTSFVTNLDDRLIVADVDLYKAITEANKQNEMDNGKKAMPKYEYPDNVVTAARVGWIVNKGIPYELAKTDAVFIRELDAQKAAGKGIFGSGFLISEKAAAEKAAAEKAAAEKAAAEKAAAEKAAAENIEVHIWELSEREKLIIQMLGG